MPRRRSKNERGVKERPRSHEVIMRIRRYLMHNRRWKEFLFQEHCPLRREEHIDILSRSNTLFRLFKVDKETQQEKKEYIKPGDVRGAGNKRIQFSARERSLLLAKRVSDGNFGASKRFHSTRSAPPRIAAS